VRVVLRVLAVLLVLGVSAAAQTSSRIATTVEALTTSPVFFHGRQVVVRRGVIEEGRLWRLAETAKPVFVFWKDRPALSSDSEIRGEFWDVGRLQRDDPRFSGVDLNEVIQVASRGEWPARDRVFVLLGATAVESPLPADPTLRAIAIAPERYANRSVTVVGRFRGVNLYGDLPQPVGKSRWDFVLQSADGAVWVTGLRPRGKGFDLDTGARVDTGRWLQVTGTVRREGALTWIEASAIATATAPSETPIDITVPAPPREIAPTVVFTAPIVGEVDADRSTPIRIQFSRDIDPRTFRDHVRASYTGMAPPGAPASPPSFTARYNEGSHALEIRFSEPLDRFRSVKIDLLEGIMSAVDNQPLAPWSLTFTTGG
jgi:Bacterial Ig-like domain